MSQVALEALENEGMEATLERKAKEKSDKKKIDFKSLVNLAMKKKG